MSWLSKQLKSAKKIVTDPGKVLNKAKDIGLPVLGFALGGPAGAAIGSAAAQGIGHGKPDLGKVAAAGATGYLGSSALGGTGGGTLSKVFGGSGGPSTGIVDKLGGWGGVAQLGLGALGAYQGAKEQGKANDLNRQAMDLAMNEWNAGAPLRDRSRELAMTTPPSRDLSAIFADPGNPYNRIQAPGAAPEMTPPPSSLTQIARPDITGAMPGSSQMPSRLQQIFASRPEALSLLQNPGITTKTPFLAQVFGQRKTQPSAPVDGGMFG